ncbi:MAG: hypothetical protein NZ908_02640 [Candidatus Micrarchaeota archaeon]|nr:hypothetical protein [Candidatus Micrarchaeota archaeon]MCX8154333.1 hypothetical protein [Candidatus Micrarchaeota archaeon]
MYYRIDRDRTYIRLDNTNDIWYLWNLLARDDIVEAYSLRSVEGIDEKKPVRIKLQIDRIKYMKDLKTLRVTGKILDGSPTEYIQIGRYHSFDFDQNSELYVYKSWSDYERELLNEAMRMSKESMGMLVLIDERTLKIFQIYPIGLEVIIEKDLPYSKYQDNNRDEIYQQIKNIIRNTPVIVAGPGFEKERLAEYLSKGGAKLLGVLGTSYAEVSSLKEIFPQIRELIQRNRLNLDLQIIETINMYISKYTDMVVFGDEVRNYIEGSLELIVVIDEALEDPKVREILKISENYGTKIHIMSSQSPYSENISMLRIIGIRRY